MGPYKAIKNNFVSSLIIKILTKNGLHLCIPSSIKITIFTKLYILTIKEELIRFKSIYSKTPMKIGNFNQSIPLQTILK